VRQAPEPRPSAHEGRITRREKCEERPGHEGLLTTQCVLEAILVFVIVVAGVGLLLDDALPLGLALVGIGLMIAWWRFRLPPPS
jgi:hypothetical protein